MADLNEYGNQQDPSLSVSLRVLIDVAQVFAQNKGDADSLISSVTQAIGRHLQGLCVILLVSNDHELKLAGLSDSDKALEQLLHLSFDRWSISVDSELSVAQAYRSGQPILLSERDLELLRQNLPAEQLPLVQKLAHAGLAIAPLGFHTQRFGVLLLVRHAVDLPPLRQDDLHLLQVLADRVAMAIFTSRLLEQTQQEQTARSQTEAENAFEAKLLHTVNDAVIAVDAHFNILSWNKGAEALYGYSLAEVIGKPSTEVLHTDYLDTNRDALLTDLNQNGVWSGEVRQYRKDGAPVIVMASINTLPADLSRSGYITVNRDITARKRDDDKRKLLADATQVFSRSNADHQGVLEEIARITATAVNSVAIIRHLSDDEHWLKIVAYYDAHPNNVISDDMRLEVAQQARQLPAVSMASAHGSVQTLRRKIAFFAPSIDPDYFRSAFTLEEQQFFGAASIHSYMSVPLYAAERAIGTLSVYRTQSEIGGFTEDDKHLIQDLADRAAMAMGTALALQESQRELAERRRVEAHVNFQAKLLQSIHDAVIATDSERRITSWNGAAERLYGWTEQDVLGKDISMVLPTSFGEMDLQQFLQRIKTEGGWQADEAHAHKDGHQIHVHTSISPVLDENGITTGYIAIQHDITDRVRAESRVNFLAEIAPPFLQINSDEAFVSGLIAKELVQQFSDSCSIFVVSADGQSLTHLAFHDRNPEIATVIRQQGVRFSAASAARATQVWRTGKVYYAREVDRDRLSADLSPAERQILMMIMPRSGIMVPVSIEERIIGVIVITRRDLSWPLFEPEDVTLMQIVATRAALAISNTRLFAQAHQEILERKRVEVALEDERALLARRVEERTADLSLVNGELNRALRAKDEFLANMSHELRTPLNSILGRSEALLEHVYGPLTEGQTKSIQGTLESGQHLLSLINDILDLAKVDSGKLTLDYDLVRIDALCMTSVRMVTEAAMHKHIKISTSLDNTVETIWGDERRLKQILVNLLSNAVKFTPPNGRIDIEVVANEKNRTITLAVQDTGIGIAEEDLPRLFKPFVQLDNRLTRQYEGTGLGLSLVLRLAEAHQGSVTVQSKRGEGSRFSVTLPWPDDLADEDSQTSYPGRPDQASLSAAVDKGEGVSKNAHLDVDRVLLIEDSLSTSMQITRYLSRSGIRLERHPRGVGALEKAIQLHPDVILLDILLPDQEGWDVLRALKNHSATKNIPVVIVSVLNDPNQARDLGAAAMLVKPVNRDRLIATLHQVTQRDVRPEWSRSTDQPNSHPRRRILLAEDNQANIEIIQDYLMSQNYDVVLARNGSEAVLRAQEDSPDVIIMDIQMPVMDGLEAMRRIRNIEAVRELPIIALTALAMPGDRERCVAAGANEYIMKPVHLRQLILTLQKLLAP